MVNKHLNGWGTQMSHREEKGYDNILGADNPAPRECGVRCRERRWGLPLPTVFPGGARAGEERPLTAAMELMRSM